MSSDSLLPIPCLLFPEVLVTYFDQTAQEVSGEDLHFSFTERNKVSEEHSAAKLNSKGFFPEATVQGFPIRGKDVFLHITRHRWLDENADKAVSRNRQLVAKGTRITSEFATFLKEIHQ
jgi:hypothetical protein